MRSATIVFKNGESFEIPRIYSAHGWIYRPDEARTDLEIRRGTNKSFGRTSDHAVASAWLRTYIQNNFDRVNWSPIAQIDINESYLDREKGIAGMGMEAAYRTQGLGWQTLGFHAKRDDGMVSIQVSWNGWNVQSWYQNQSVPQELSFRNPVKRETIHHKVLMVNVEKAYTLAARFAENPIQFANQHLPEEFPVGPIQPDIDWPDRGISAYRPKEVTQDVLIAIDQNHVYWKNRQELSKVVVESRDAFDKIAAAFEHLGLAVHFKYETDWHSADRKQYLRAAEFVIPASNSGDPLETVQHNMFGHTIDITQRGIDVTCGYVEDQQRWEEMQKRNMANWLSEMHEEIQTDNSEEWEYTPNND